MNAKGKNSKKRRRILVSFKADRDEVMEAIRQTAIVATGRAVEKRFDEGCETDAIRQMVGAELEELFRSELDKRIDAAIDAHFDSESFRNLVHSRGAELIEQQIRVAKVHFDYLIAQEIKLQMAEA